MFVTRHSLIQHIQRRPGLWAGVIICLTTLTRIWFVASGQLDLVQDEAHYWDWTHQLQLSYYSKGPLVAYLIALGTKVFGVTEFGVRSMAILGSLAMQVLLYWGLAGLWQRPRTALWALIIANTMPLFMAAGILMTTDNPLLVCWLAAMFLLYAASSREEPSLRYFSFLALVLALGILAKYTMAIFVPLALAYSLGVQRQGMLPRGYWSRLIWSLSAGTVLGFLPILVWNARHDWVGLLHVLNRGAVGSGAWQDWFDLLELPEYLGSQLGVLTPWWFVFVLIGAVVIWKGLRGKLAKPYGLNHRQIWLLGVGFWPVWLFFLVWSLHTHVEANWSAVSYAAGIILAALAWEGYWSRAVNRQSKLRYLWLGLGIAIFILIHIQNLLPLPAKYNPAARLKGWQDLGQEVQELQYRRFETPSQVFVFSSRYNITASLSFYVPGQRAYCVNIGRRLNQYDFWPGPTGRQGWGGIYVRKETGKGIDPRIKQMFDRVSKRIDYITTHRGQPARGFSIYLCYGFNGHWPEPPQGSF